MSGIPAILGPDGRVVNAERVRTEKLSRFNPLRNLTPDVVVRHLEAFSRGEIAQLAWLMEWLEIHDDTISTVAPKAKAAVSRYGYDVQIKDEVPENQRGLAEDQASKMESFLQNLEAEDAIELEEAGGMRLFVQQIMDAYGKRYAAHHIVWNPSRHGLRARLIKVPTWMFEATTGHLRFLSGPYSLQGVELAELGGRSAWFTAKGRGVMLPSVIARMFKQIPLQDWLTYCDRHGMPAFLGKTNAVKDSPGWNQMVSAVGSIGSEFGAVINTGDVIDVLSLTGSGDLPYEKLIDRMDRAIVMLWRGGDLSTISRANGVGSNPQQDDADELDADNAEWVGETIDRGLGKPVIGYYFGAGVPVLVTVKIRTKTRKNVTEELATVTSAVSMKMRVSESWFADRFNIQLADAGEKAIGEPIAPVTPPPADATAINTAPEFRALLETSISKALGIRPQVLAAVRPLIDDLANRSHEAGVSDADLLQLCEDMAEAMPEFVDSAATAEMAVELEKAMGTAAMQGARDAIRETNTKDQS